MPNRILKESIRYSDDQEGARKSFAKPAPDGPLLHKMPMALEQQAESVQWQKAGGQYIPNPSARLNQGRREDELPQRDKPVACNRNAAPPSEAVLFRTLLPAAAKGQY